MNMGTFDARPDDQINILKIFLQVIDFCLC